MNIKVGFKVSRSSLYSSMSEKAQAARAKEWKMSKPFKERDQTARAHLFVLVQEGAAMGSKKEPRLYELKAFKMALMCRGNHKVVAWQRLEQRQELDSRIRISRWPTMLRDA
jgi:hypothetical protein